MGLSFAAMSAAEGITKKDENNPMGIPTAVFIEDVPEFMRIHGGNSTEKVLQEMQEVYSKYKFLEQNLVSRKSQLLNKLPDIVQTLEAVTLLIKKAVRNLVCWKRRRGGNPRVPVSCSRELIPRAG